MEGFKHFNYIILEDIPEFLVEEKRETIRPRGPLCIATKDSFHNLFLCKRGTKKVILFLGNLLPHLLETLV
jgi:hypothetical protein